MRIQINELCLFSSGNDPKSRQNATIGNTVKNEKENCIKVPKIYWEFTRKAVLTMEWIDGIKLTDQAALERACLNRRKLIDLVCCYRAVLIIYLDRS
jgi:aarF domain-containing kinase